MDIRSNLHNRMRTLKQNKDVSIDYKKIPSHVCRAVAFSIQHAYRIVRSHPVLTGLALFLLLLYTYLPSLFGFLISSSPVIICTTLLLGTLLSFGEPDLPEIDEEEMKMSHDVSSSMQQVRGVSDDLVSKKDEEEFETASVLFHKSEIEEEYSTASFHVDEDMVKENESGALQTRVSMSSRCMLEEDNNIALKSVVMGNKREIEEDTTLPRMPFHGFPDVDDVQKDGSTISITGRSLESKKHVETEHSTVTNQVVDAETEISGMHLTLLTAEVKEDATSRQCPTNDWVKEDPHTEREEKGAERKYSKDEFFEKIYIHEEMLAEDASVGAESAPDLDPNAHEDTAYVKAESDGTPTGICYYSLLSTKKSSDGPDDSGSDASENSSSDASMADIIPMLDELRPFLDADLSRPVHINIDSNDDDGDDDDDNGEEEEDASEGSFSDAKSDSDTEKHVAEDQPHPVTQKEKPTETEFVLSWTPDDEKNLMDLGLSEFERNQRLENMIARRRARKGLENSMSFHNAAVALNIDRITPLDVHIPPVSVRRNNPFDNHYDSQELKGLPPVPGSAPSVFSRRRNPFEFPYWERNESDNTTSDGLHHMEFVSEKLGSPSETFEGFTFDPSSSGDNREEKPGSNVAQHFPTAKTESATYSKYERQLSRLSDPRLSSISEPEPVSPVVEGCDEEPGERELLLENHMFSTSNHSKDVAVQPEQEERNIDFSSIKEGLGILATSDMAPHEITKELEPAISDAPQSIVLEGESDESDTSTEKDDIIYANNHDVTIDPESIKPYLSTDPSDSLNAASQESDAQHDDPGLSGQDLNSADEAFIISHRNIERSIPYEIGNLSNDDAAWLREIAEMRKLELSGNSQESQAQSNMHLASISAIESESYEQLQVNTVQKLDNPMADSQELADADNLTSCTPGHPYLPVDEPVLLPSYSCGAESRIDILPPISEEIAADSNHKEHHGILETVMEKSNELLSDDAIDPPLPEYATIRVQPLAVPSHHDSSNASPGKETVKTVNDGSVNLSVDELGTSQFLDVQSCDEVTTNELDEGLLSELDVVGDFSVQNLDSSRSILHSHLGDNGPSSMTFEEARTLCENQEIGLEMGLPTKELNAPEDEGYHELIESHSDMQEVEAESIDDIHHALKNFLGASQFLTEQPTDMQFLSSVQDAESHNPECTDLAVEQLSVVSSSHISIQNIEDTGISLQDEARSTEVVHSAVKDQVECTNDGASGQSEAETFHFSLNEVEASVEDSCLSTKNVLSESLITDCAWHEVEETPLKDAVAAMWQQEVDSMPVVTADLDDSELKYLEDVQLTVRQKEIGSESVASCSALPEVEESSPEDLILKQKDAYSEPVTTHSDLPEAEELSLKENEFVFTRQEKLTEKVAVHSQMHEVEAQSVDDLHAVFRQHGIESVYGIHSEPHEVEEHSAENLVGTKLNLTFSLGQEDRSEMQTIDHSEMHEIEAQSLEDIHMAFGRQVIITKSETDLPNLEITVDELLVKEVQNLGFAMDPPDMQSEEIGDYSEIHEIEAQSLADLHAVFGKHSEEDSPANDSEPHVFEAPSRNIVEKETTAIDFAVDQQMHAELLSPLSEMHEVEARSYADLHIILQQQGVLAETVTCSEPLKYEVRTVTKGLEKEITDGDSALDQEKHLKPTDHSKMHGVEAGSLDSLGVGFEQHSDEKMHKVQTQSAEESMERESIDSDLLVNQDLLEIEDTPVYGLSMSDEELFTQMDVTEEGILSSGSFVHPDLHEIEAHSLDELHLALSQKTTELDILEKEVNLPESQSSFHEIEAYSLDDLHLALGKQVSLLKTSLIQSGQHELETQSLGEGNMRSESPETQDDLHEIEVHSLDDLHLALGRQGMLSALSQKEHKVETQSLEKENAHSGPSVSCSDLPDSEVCSSDGVALDPSLVLSDLQKVETQNPEKERELLESAAENSELDEVKEQSIKDIKFASEQLMEDNASTRDEHVEIKQAENINYEVKSSSFEVSLPEAEPSKLVSQVFVRDDTLISNSDASSTKILE